MNPGVRTILGLSVLVLTLVSGCGKPEKTVQKEPAVPVRTMKVELKTIAKTLDYVGDIKAQDEAMVYPKVNGKVIEKLKDEGQTVVKGDTIVYLDRDEVGFKFEKAPVESPLTGVIGRLNVDIGTNVSPQTPVALVVDMDNVKIRLDIPEEFFPRVTVGQFAEVTLQAYPGEKFVGTVSRISPVLELETRTAPVEILIPNADHRLKSGMYANVHLIIEEHKDVPVIIKEALIGKAPDQYVYIVSENRALQKRVKVGANEADLFEVSEGLKQGEMVVIMGQQNLYNQAPVTVEEGEGK